MPIDSTDLEVGDTMRVVLNNVMHGNLLSVCLIYRAARHKIAALALHLLATTCGAVYTVFLVLADVCSPFKVSMPYAIINQRYHVTRIDDRSTALPLLLSWAEVGRLLKVMCRS